MPSNKFHTHKNPVGRYEHVSTCQVTSSAVVCQDMIYHRCNSTAVASQTLPFVAEHQDKVYRWLSSSAKVSRPIWVVELCYLQPFYHSLEIYLNVREGLCCTTRFSRGFEQS